MVSRALVWGARSRSKVPTTRTPPNLTTPPPRVERGAQAGSVLRGQWLTSTLREFIPRGPESRELMLITVSVTTVAWLAVTALTAPEPTEHLVKFCRLVRSRVALAAECQEEHNHRGLWQPMDRVNA